MEERYGEIYYVTDDERTSIERGLTAIFWVSESPARHLELRQRGARLADAPASGSPSSVCGRGDRLNALTLRRCRWIARTMAEAGFPGARGRRVRPCGVPQAPGAGEGARILRRPASLHGGDGGLRRGASLGA